MHHAMCLYVYTHIYKNLAIAYDYYFTMLCVRTQHLATLYAYVASAAYDLHIASSFLMHASRSYKHTCSLSHMYLLYPHWLHMY